jgi:hypothetical protein
LTLALEFANPASTSLPLVHFLHGVDTPSSVDEPFDISVGAAKRATPGQVFVRLVVGEQRSGSAQPNEVISAAARAAGQAFVATAVGLEAGLLVIASPRALNPLEGAVGAVVSAADVSTMVVPPATERVRDCPFHVVVAVVVAFDGVPQTGHVTENICEFHNWFQTSFSPLHGLHPSGSQLSGVSMLAHDRVAQVRHRCATRLGALGIKLLQILVVVRSGLTSKVIVDHVRRKHATQGVLPVVISKPGHRRTHGATNAVLSTSPLPMVLFHAFAAT